MRTKRLWAATWTHWGDDFLEHTVRRTREEVMREIGATWARESDGGTWRLGWRRAHRSGARAVRVDVTLSHQPEEGSEDE